MSRIDIIGQNGNDYPPDAGQHHLYKHGHRTKTFTSPTYKTWQSMRFRCRDQSNINYGGRGIQVCAEWEESFEAFLADMGERPQGHTLDRIDPDGDYCPENCRWATNAEQAANRKNVSWVEYEGHLHMISEAARLSGIPLSTLFRRYKEGVRGAELFCPINRNRGKPKR